MSEQRANESNEAAEKQTNTAAATKQETDPFAQRSLAID